MTPRIVWFGAPGSDQAPLVGGKAATLARLATAFPVPPGFCVTAVDPAPGADLSPAVEDDIRRAYGELGVPTGADVAVAVRSSAVDEDGALASFAGVHNTYLNVTTADAVIDAVRRCIDSALSAGATAYRERHHLGATGVQIAVLVQRMISVDAAFVAFSRHPLRAGTDDVVVNCAWGLGESIAQGTTTPDAYTVRRSDPFVVEQVVGRQVTWVVPVPGGIATRDLPESLRDVPAFDERQLGAVVDLVIRCEAEMGCPVDVEGGRVGNELFLLQCRPITRTSLPPVVGDDGQVSWLREDIHFPGVVTPVGGEYARLGMYAGMRQMQEELDWPSRADATVVNGRVYVKWLYLPSGDALEAARCDRDRDNLTRAAASVPVWEERIRPRLDAIFGWFEHASLEGAASDAVAVWRRAWKLIEEVWYLHFVLLYPCLAGTRHLEATCTELFGDDGAREAWKVVSGRTETVHGVETDLHALADAARASAEVTALLQEPAEVAHARLGGVAGGRAFLAQLADFVVAHGHLGAELDDPAVATWRDEPWRILADVSRVLRSGESPEKRRRALLAEGDAALRRLRERSGSDADHRRLDEAVTLARSVFPFVEDHNYWIDRMIHARTRDLLLRVGGRLTHDGVLDRASDVWFLLVDEVERLLERPEDRRALVRDRRRDMRSWARVAASPAAGSEGAHAPVMAGVAGSPGVATGRACVVRSNADLAGVQEGDVLVCHSTNVSWVALLSSVGGVVTSTGGMLCHGAVVARELGVPAVVGVAGAVDVLRPGSVVEVDGDRGTVRVVAEPGAQPPASVAVVAARYEVRAPQAG